MNQLSDAIFIIKTMIYSLDFRRQVLKGIDNGSQRYR